MLKYLFIIIKKNVCNIIVLLHNKKDSVYFFIIGKWLNLTKYQIVGNFITYKYKNEHYCPTNTSQDINYWGIKCVHEINKVRL